MSMIEHQTGFTGNWFAGAGEGSWSQRRRLMALLRRAHRVLGVNRKDLGVGSLGLGGPRSALLASASPASMIGGLAVLAAIGLVPGPASAQYAAGGGTATGGGSVAIGASSSANGLRGVAIGSGATQSGIDSIAHGTSANAGSQNAIAIGFQSVASALNSINIGARTVPNTGALATGAIAIGTDTTASQFQSTAIGIQATASGTAAVALGTGAVASGTSAIALGTGAASSNVNSVAIGASSSATAAGSSALGTFANATGSNSTAVGVGATSSNNFAWAGGYQSVASGPNSLAIGRQSLSDQLNSVAIGTEAAAQGQQALAIGYQATNTGFQSISLGSLANANGNATIAVGPSASATNFAGIAIGQNSVTDGNSTISIGRATQSHGIDSTAIGATSATHGNAAVALGQGAVAGTSGDAAGTANAIAIGTGAQATTLNAIAAGTGAVANSADAVAIGTNSTATGGRAVAIGAGNTANGNGAVAIGDPNTATGDGAVAQGMDNTATGNGSVAMGNTNMVGGGGQAVSTPGTAAQGAVGIGYQNTVVGQGSVAIGNSSSALAAGAVAFGDMAVANNAGDVALGSGSVTDAAVATASTDINGTTYNFAGTAPASTVSVGSTGAERTITNVAAGRVSATSTDAVNGSQLFATNQAVEAIGDGWTITAEGTNATNVGVDSATGNSVDLSNSDGNIEVTKDASSNDVSFELADNITVDSLTAGGTVLNSSGLTILGGPSVTLSGINAGGMTVTNVAAGVNPTDAVNVSQLTGATSGITTAGLNFTGNDNSAGDVHRDLGQTLAIQGAATSAGTYSGGNIRTVTDPATGAVNIQLADAPSFGTVTVNDGGSGRITGVTAGVAATDAVNVSQLQAVSNTANLGWNIQANGDTATRVAPGDTVQLVNGQNIEITRNGTDVTIATSADLVADSVTLASGQVLDATGLDMAGTTITDLADGEVSATSTDAINGSQLFATNQAVEAVAQLSGNTDERAVKYDWTDSNGNGIVDPGEVDYNSATLAGVGGTTLTNVAAGAVNATSTDAINGSQLHGVSTSIATHLGGSSVVNPDGTITGPTYVVQGGNYTTVFDAFNAVDGELTNINSALTTIINGGGIMYFHANSALADSQATGVNSVAIGPASTAAAADAVSIGNGALASNAGDVALGSGSTTAAVVATAGTTINGTNYNFAGAAPTSTVSVGAVGAERTVTNVAAGQISATSTDAVNGSQLHATNQAVGALGDRVTNIEGDITNLTNDINSGNVGLVRQTGGSSGPITVGALTGGTSIDVSGTAGDRVISGLADGVANNDAVTVRQLAAAITNVVVNGAPFTSNNGSGGAAPVSSGTNSVAGGYGAVASGARSSALGVNSSATGNNSVALGYGSTDGGLDNVVSVGAVGAERQITNVAAGTRPTDAVNVSQLNTGLANNLTLANQYTDNRLAELSFDLSDARKDADSGTATAMAVSGLPQVMNPGGAMVAGGFGVYRGETAFAVGLSKASDDGRFILKGGATISTRSSHIGANVGVGYQFGD
ncbi:MAG TPA: YadA-like family protein [Sphingomicrobium sp.]|nr:YadA-like family protein [Sphingomicrobium sp.]